MKSIQIIQFLIIWKHVNLNQFSKYLERPHCELRCYTNHNGGWGNSEIKQKWKFPGHKIFTVSSSGRIEVLTLSFRFPKDWLLGDLYSFKNGKNGFSCWTPTFVLIELLLVHVGSGVHIVIDWTLSEHSVPLSPNRPPNDLLRVSPFRLKVPTSRNLMRYYCYNVPGGQRPTRLAQFYSLYLVMWLLRIDGDSVILHSQINT